VLKAQKKLSGASEVVAWFPPSGQTEIRKQLKLGIKSCMRQNGHNTIGKT
jgi:hypothetical protein